MDCLLDSGAMFSAVVERDRDHLQARASLRTPNLRLFTTAAAMGELYTLIRRRSDYAAAIGVSRRVRTDFTIETRIMDADLEHDTWPAVEEFAGVPLSYVDASLGALGRRLRIRHTFSFDDDLRAAGLTLVPGR
ncbi:MAG: PIN domain-containing protein [Tepidiformaceae bacterium]